MKTALVSLLLFHCVICQPHINSTDISTQDKEFGTVFFIKNLHVYMSSGICELK